MMLAVPGIGQNRRLERLGPDAPRRWSDDDDDNEYVEMSNGRDLEPVLNARVREVADGRAITLASSKDTAVLTIERVLGALVSPIYIL